MRGTGVHFDLRGQVRLSEGFFEDRFVAGRTLVVVCRDRDEKLRLGLGGLKMRAVRHIGHQAAAME